MATYKQGTSFAPLPDASYQRMLKAGLPTGGIDVFERTMAQQRKLHSAYLRDPKNNPVAAAPSLSAPHIRRYAFDAQTTRDGKYSPSAAHKWLSDGTRGDLPPRSCPGEKPRAREYGWVRSVPSERWHWQYYLELDKVLWRIVQKRLGGLVVDGIPGTKTKAALEKWQKKNGLTVDGIPGEKTLAKLDKDTGVTPAPAPVRKADVRVATFNTLDPRFSGPLTAARIKGLCAAIVAAKADVYLLTEAPEQIRDHLRGACSCKAAAHVRLPGGAKRWLVRVFRAVAILRDSTKWASGKTGSVALGTSYHGGLWETLTHASGTKVSFAVYHLPPDSTTAKTGQQKLLAGFLGKLPSGVRIVGGDGANSASWLAGYADARIAAKESSTRNAATYDKGGTPDRIGSKGAVEWRGYTVHPTTASDHNLVVTAATITA